MIYKPPSKTRLIEVELIPLKEAMEYVSFKDDRFFKTRIKGNPKWGEIIEGETSAGDRYFVWTDMLQKYLDVVYK